MSKHLRLVLAGALRVFGVASILWGWLLALSSAPIAGRSGLAQIGAVLFFAAGVFAFAGAKKLLGIKDPPSAWGPRHLP